MKRQFLSLLMALCLILTLAPAVFAADTSGLQDLINGTEEGGTLELTSNYTITDTVVIAKGITIVGNGHSITINVANTPALAVTTNSAVELKNVTVNATLSGGIGIDLNSISPTVTLTNSTVNASSRGIRFYHENAAFIFTRASLTLDGSHVLNSNITSGDYANETTVGDTRGIGLYGVESSTITLKNSSSIKGFGYSINTSANVGTNGVRPGGNTYNISNSDIWGWSAFNVWTVGNTFNITSCDLRGINPLNTLGNSFCVFVLNNGIYGTNPSEVAPNIFNIAGGTIDAKMTVTTSMVEETIACIDDQFMTEFHFSKAKVGLLNKKVVMTCDTALSAIICNGDSSLDAPFATWAASSKLTGPENASYNQLSWSLLFPNGGLIAPGVYAGLSKSSTTTATNDVAYDTPHHATSMIHVGGESE